MPTLPEYIIIENCTFVLQDVDVISSSDGLIFTLSAKNCQDMVLRWQEILKSGKHYLLTFEPFVFCPQFCTSSWSFYFVNSTMFFQIYCNLNLLFIFLSNCHNFWAGIAGCGLGKDKPGKNNFLFGFYQRKKNYTSKQRILFG